MPTYGYIRTSRDQEPGHPGSDPHVQRRQFLEAGVDAARIYADVAASGAKDYNSRDQWHVLDQQLAQGDVLVVVAIDRLGRRYLETMWAIYDLQRRGIKLRSLADNEVQWTKYLDADPDSPEAFMGNVLASMAAYVASQERQNISRRTGAGLQAARDKGVELNQYQGGMCISGRLTMTERNPRHLISPLGPTGWAPIVRSGDMYISPWL